MILPAILFGILVMIVLFVALKINSGNVRNRETGKIHRKSNIQGGCRRRRNSSNKKIHK